MGASHSLGHRFRSRTRGRPVHLKDQPVKYEKIVYLQTPQAELKMHVYYPPDWQKTDERPTSAEFGGHVPSQDEEPITT